MSDTGEGKPLQSKKFAAYLVAELTWKIALLVVLVMGLKNGTIDVIVGSIALTIVIIAGFIEAGYIIGQASLDKYTRIAQIAAQNGKSFSMKGLQVSGGSDAKKDPGGPTGPAV
jgi:hypothetical protein